MEERSLIIKNKKFVVKSVRASHPDHESLVATWSGRTYLVRVFFVPEMFDKAMADYKTLKHAGINMAKICFHDDPAHVIVFDYFPEEDCLSVLSKGPIEDRYFEALFALYRFARFSKVALDWQPQNFMLRGSQMFYLPTKWEKLTDENPLEKTGLRYWFLGEEGRALLTRKGYKLDGLPSLSELEVNKALVLKTVRYW
ncbi:MAG TPA: hypothetical protein DEA63_03830 [Firmicutes bacterium]|nr:hypothetical protein [Bacillota bacterium]